MRLVAPPPRLVVLGLGGAGNHVVAALMAAGLDGVDFVIADTDAHALQQGPSCAKLQLGPEVTSGLGAGAQVERGRWAAEETLDEVRGQLAGTDVLFLLAGLGGGTGTGAAPVIARAAREHAILTIGIVSMPFRFEGRRRGLVAQQGLADLAPATHGLIRVSNRGAADDATAFEALAAAGARMGRAVECVANPILREAPLRLSLANLRWIMNEAGLAEIGSAEASGDDGITRAAEAALAELAEAAGPLSRVRGALVSVEGGPEVNRAAVDEAAVPLRRAVDPAARIALASAAHPSWMDRVRVSMIAIGLDS